MKSLGLRETDYSGLAKIMSAGLPFARLTRFQKTSGFPLERIARVLHIPARTLARRKKSGRLKPDESERLLRLARLFDQAIDLFEGDVAAAAQWFREPVRGLAEQAPLTFAETEFGAREVENLIGRLEHGVYT
ncbi:MAG: DUF2384 domain-containing protein [Gemmataceae bacterium]|nr:DUF2384 domain-containing protein [Gemmataceae bacterium]MCI0741412.1 DUF2384 domain-containing protein [Gemmataceae bacterium]